MTRRPNRVATGQQSSASGMSVHGCGIISQSFEGGSSTVYLQDLLLTKQEIFFEEENS